MFIDSQDSDIGESLQSTPTHLSEPESLGIHVTASACPVNTTGHSEVWKDTDSVCISGRALPLHLSFLDSSLI